MIANEKQCATCGGPLGLTIPGLGSVCPSCVVKAASTPRPDSKAGHNSTATWADAFPQLAINQVLRDDPECPVYLATVLGDAVKDQAILQVVTGAALKRAGGCSVFQTRAQRLATCEIDGLVAVLDHGDLADTYFLITEAPSGIMTIPHALQDRGADELAAILVEANAQADAIVRAGQSQHLALRFDPETCFFDEASGQLQLTPLLFNADERLNTERELRTFQLAAGNRLGPFTLTDKLGEGGFGQVWRARQTAPVERDVAVKILKDGFHSQRARTRFKVEQQALARLEHPHIARFIEGGSTSEGRPYFAMEWIEGVAITKHCQQIEAGLEERLALFREVCQAIQHAHQKGIIHRDLKPSNVMVSVNASAPAIKIIDFGIARALETPFVDATLLTKAEELVGTPAFMSPEQAAGASGADLDARTDVYGLGVLLYELLTGTLPFDPNLPSDELRRRIRSEDPALPSTCASETAFQRQLRGDLDWMVLKCLEKDPDRRYASVSALEDELHRHLTDEPIEAGPPSASYRFQKFARRNKSLLATMTAVTVILVLASIISTWLAFRATNAEALAQNRLGEVERERNDKEEARLEAERQRDEALWNEYAARQFPITAAWENGEFGHLDALLEQQKPAPEHPDFRSWEWYFLKDQCEQAFHTIDGGCAVWHPTEHAVTVIVSKEGKPDSIQLRSPVDGALIRTVVEDPLGIRMTYLRWDGEGKRLAYLTNGNGLAVVIDAHSGETIFSKPLAADVVHFDLSGDGKLLATGQQETELIQLWNVDTGECFRELDPPYPNSDALRMLGWLEFSPDGSQVLASLRFGVRATWDVNTGERFDYHRVAHSVGVAGWNASGTKFATVEGGKVAIFKPHEPSALGVLPHQSVSAVNWLGDSTVATSGFDHYVRLWNADTFEKVTEFQVSSGGVIGVAGRDDEDFLAVSQRDRDHILIINRRNPQRTALILDPKASFNTGRHLLAWHSGNRYIASAYSERTNVVGTYSGESRIWDVDSEALFRREPTKITRSLGWNADQSAALLSLYPESVNEIGLGAEQVVDWRLFPKNRAGSSVLSPNGKWLALSFDGLLTRCLVDVATQQVITSVEEPSLANYWPRWSHDHRLFAATSWTELIVWDPFANRILRSKPLDCPSRSIAWDPSNTFLMLGRRDGRIAIVRADTLEDVASLTGHVGEVYDVDWAGNGRLASAGDDGTVRVWDANTGDELLKFSHPDQTAFSGVRWSPDGRRLAAGDERGRVFVWGSDKTALTSDRPQQLVSGLLVKDEARSGMRNAKSDNSDQIARSLQEVAEAISGDASIPSEKTVSLLLALAKVCEEMDLFPGARNVAQDAVVELQQRLGSEHPVVIDANLSLAELLADQDFTDEAVELAKHSLDLRRQSHTTDDPFLLMDELRMASLYAAAGMQRDVDLLLAKWLPSVDSVSDWQEYQQSKFASMLGNAKLAMGQASSSVKLRRRLLEILKSHIDTGDVESTTAVSDIGYVLMDAETEEPVAALKQLVACLRTARGANHCKTVAAEICLGHALLDLRRPQEAVQVMESAHAALLEYPKAEDVRKMVASWCLANAYRGAGKPETALPLYQEALTAHEARLGQTHPRTKAVRCHFALSCFLARDREKGEALSQRLIEQFETSGNTPPFAVVGNETSIPNVEDANLFVDGLIALGSWLRESDDSAGWLREHDKDLKTAMRCFQEALFTKLRSRDLDSLPLLSVVVDLVITYQDQGREEDLRALFQGLLALEAANLEPTNHDFVLSALGDRLRDARRHPEALALHEERFLRRENWRGPGKPGHVGHLIDLAGFQRTSGYYERALELWHRIEERLRKDDTPGDDRLFTIASARRGHCLIRMGRPREGIVLLERALPIFGADPGERTQWATAQMMLAEGYLADGKLAKAATAFEHAREGYQRDMKLDVFARQTGWEHLTQCYQRLGRYEDAAALDRNLFELRKEQRGLEDRFTLEAQSRYGLTLLDTGHYDEALAVLERAAHNLESFPAAALYCEVLGGLAESYDGRAGRGEAMEEALAKQRQVANGILETAYRKAAKFVEGASTIVAPEAAWRWFCPSEAKSSIEPVPFATFHLPSYDDRHWHQGSGTLIGGFGFHGVGGAGTTRHDLFFKHSWHVSPEDHAPQQAYFRHRFSTEDSYDNVRLLLQHNDGVVVFLDGKEVGRRNVFPGPVHAGLRARRPQRHWTDVTHLELADTLDPGDHVLSISLHNFALWKPDDLRLAGVTLLGNRRPAGERQPFSGVDPGGNDGRQLADIAYFFAERSWHGGNHSNAKDQLLVSALPDLAMNPSMLQRTGTEPPRWLGPLLKWDCFKSLSDLTAGSPPNQILVEPGSSWRYHTEHAVAAAPLTWYAPDFDDTSWKEATAPLGYGDSAVVGEVTTEERAFCPNTVYFRHSFTIAQESHEDLCLFLRADDGAAVYLNGTEVLRLRLDDGPLGQETFAHLLDEPLEGRYSTHLISAHHLRPGENVLAVEVHQESPWSSDIIFDLELRSFSSRAIYGEIRRALQSFEAEKALGEIKSTTTISLPDLPHHWRRRVEGQFLALTGNWQGALAEVEKLIAGGASDPSIMHFRQLCVRTLEQTDDRPDS